MKAGCLNGILLSFNLNPSHCVTAPVRGMPPRPLDVTGAIAAATFFESLADASGAALKRLAIRHPAFILSQPQSLSGAYYRLTRRPARTESISSRLERNVVISGLLRLTASSGSR